MKNNSERDRERCMARKKFIIYFVAPLTVSLILIGMYFSGVESLQRIITPHMQNLHPNSAREFGLLENLQNVLLLSMCAMGFMGIRRQKLRLGKAAMAALGVFSAFVLLEEIDYGLHYYEWIMNVPVEELVQERNLHNVGDRTSRSKQIVDVAMVLFFVVMPFVCAKSRKPLVRYLTPDRFSVLTMVCMVLVRTLAHGLNDRGFGTGGGIVKNISEFRELITYYVFTLYVFEIAIRRTPPGGDLEALSSATAGEKDGNEA